MRESKKRKQERYEKDAYLDTHGRTKKQIARIKRKKEKKAI